MSLAALQPLTRAQSGFRKDWDLALRLRLTEVFVLLARYTGADGTIPVNQSDTVVRQAGDIIQRAFVGANLRASFDGQGHALAAFPRLLTQYAAQGQGHIILSHARDIQHRLKNAPELIQWLTTAAPDLADIREARDIRYDPFREWIDPRGYGLSERIWQSSIRTRLRMDALLASGIREGHASLNMAKDLEQFLLPSRKPLRTRRPYGTDVSYDAMRLARTEISRALATATHQAAADNPFVDRIDWSLSISHPKRDICDTLATLDGRGGRLKDAYTIAEAPLPVVDSHPQCLCYTLPVVTQTPAQVVSDLRRDFFQRNPAPVTPLAGRNYFRLLLGAGLGYLTYQQLTG